MSDSTCRNIWKQLSKVSSSLKGILPPVPQSLGRRELGHPSTIPTLTLAVPQDFLSFLNELRLPSLTLQQSRSRVQAAIDDLRTLHENSYNDMCSKFLQLNTPSSSSHHIALFEGIKKTHEASFCRQLPRIREEFLKTYEQVRMRTTSQSKRTAFNSEYTPFLEQYFEYNAFPSARDRELLARKSSMTPRQIEVWFQNHRRRARKDGKHLKRMSSDPLPVKLSLDTLEREMPSLLVREKDRRSPSLESRLDSSEAQARTTTSIGSSPLDCIPTPIHAFPTIYPPPPGACEPFPSNLEHHRFASPSWSRKPSTQPPHRPCLSIDDLCADFAKLHIVGVSPRRHKRHLPYTPSSRRPVPTPHPALLRPPVHPASRRSTSSPDIKFGCPSPLRTLRRHRPYDLSSRTIPFRSASSPLPFLPSSLVAKSPIPRMSSSSSISSSSTSSMPATPEQSPASINQPLPIVSHSLLSSSETHFAPASRTYSIDEWTIHSALLAGSLKSKFPLVHVST